MSNMKCKYNAQNDYCFFKDRSIEQGECENMCEHITPIEPVPYSEKETKELKPNFKIKEHNKICDELNEIYIAKNHDYGDSFGETYKKLGVISAVTRITDKVNRLQSLCTKKQMIEFESIEDTLKDLANYSIMTLIELKEEKENVIF